MSDQLVPPVPEAGGVAADLDAAGLSQLTAPDDLSQLPGLSVTADPGRHACRLQLSGRLDADTVPLFTACMTSWVERGLNRLVIDLTGVTFVDSVGAAALAHATHVLGRCGGSVHVIATPDLASDSLAASGLVFTAPSRSSSTTNMIGEGRVG